MIVADHGEYPDPRSSDREEDKDVKKKIGQK